MEQRAVETLIHQHARTQELRTSKDRYFNQIPEYTLEMQESCGRNAFWGFLLKYLDNWGELIKIMGLGILDEVAWRLKAYRNAAEHKYCLN